MNHYFSLTSRVAGETKGDYEKRLWQRSQELDASFGEDARKPIADGIGWYDGDVLIAYVSHRTK